MSPRGRPRGFDRDIALDRAMRLFWERGYEGVSLTELTTAMGVNSPSLYAAFGGKESLFRTAVARYRETYGSRTMTALSDQPTARSAIEAMLRDNAKVYTDPDLPGGCMVVLAATNFSEANAGVSGFLAEARAATEEAVTERLRRGIDNGELDGHPDPSTIAAFYLSVLNGLTMQAKDGAELARLDGVIDAAMAAWDAVVAASATASRVPGTA